MTGEFLVLHHDPRTREGGRGWTHDLLH
jgi:hypothetical protein